MLSAQIVRGVECGGEWEGRCLVLSPVGVLV